MKKRRICGVHGIKCVEMYDSLSLFSIQELIDTYPLVRRGSDNNFYVVLELCIFKI